MTSEEIRERILHSANKGNLVSNNANKIHHGKLAFTGILGICILGMTIAILFAFNKKNPIGPLITSQNSGAISKSDLDIAFSAMNNRMDKADKRMDLLAQRTWLLVIANNENAAIQQANDKQRFGVVDSGYIVFDENWKMNKSPNSMKFDDKEKEDLLKNIVK